MRLIVLYDLPTIDEKDKKAYLKFHNKLLELGFYMLQYSVYVKVIQNETQGKQIINKVNNSIPQKGRVIAFKITEKQFQDLIYLKGEKNKFEVIVGGNELVVFGGDSNN